MNGKNLMMKIIIRPERTGFKVCDICGESHMPFSYIQDK